MQGTRQINNKSMKPFMGLIAMLLMLITANASHSSTMTYYQQMTQQIGPEAEEKHNKIKELSNNYNFLTCPIEMIERQWGGVHSVNLGIYYLGQFLRESQQSNPNYDPIGADCLIDLRIYQENNAKGLIRSRPIVGSEYQEFLARASTQDQALLSLVSNVLNKETICYNQGFSTSFGYIATLNFGMQHFECFTPLGRHFVLRGPSIGWGIGVIAATTLPNIDQLNSPSFTMLLYQQQESGTYQNRKILSKLALGVGATIEQDMARAFRENADGQRYMYDIRPTLGVGISAEISRSFTYKKDKAPFYLVLSEFLANMNRAQGCEQL